MSRLLHLGSAGLALLILWALVASGVFPRYSVTQVSADSLLVQYGSPGWLLAVAWIYLVGTIGGIATVLFRRTRLQRSAGSSLSPPFPSSSSAFFVSFPGRDRWS